MEEQNKNLILAIVLSFLVIFVWYIIFPPEEPVPSQELPAEAGQEAGQQRPGAIPGISLPAPEGAASEPDPGRRIGIETGRLSGSMSLAGGRIDSLSLSDYTETLGEGSPNVTLLSPSGSSGAYFALYGWAPRGSLDFGDVPGAKTPWQAPEGAVLRPGSPVVLTWSSPKGLRFAREISVDENYLFTVRQSVENAGQTPVRLSPYGIVARQGEPETIGFYILHEGAVRSSDGELQETSYDDMQDLDYSQHEQGNLELVQVRSNGWVGFTDKYWMTTMMPAAGQTFESVVKYTAANDTYQTEIRLPEASLAPGESATVETRLFAGAKEWDVIRRYEAEHGIDQFVDSIDWGWFFFLTKPMFQLLHWLNAQIGNMGWSIIALTLILKAVLFPLAFKSYKSMAKMKELQPEMEKIKKKAGEDRQALQREMMALYKKEKVNPASGCLPMLLQVPIFFALYKVIFVTIEIRHAPWLAWIRDLSAPDPTSILNLFGLLPYSVPDLGLFQFFSLSVLSILLGVSMWLQMKLNPAPTDETQKLVFGLMPWFFMFLLGTFASGLLIYWIANNIITFFQQYTIMRIQGYTPDLVGNITASFRRKKDGES